MNLKESTWRKVKEKKPKQRLKVKKEKETPVSLESQQKTLESIDKLVFGG